MNVTSRITRVTAACLLLALSACGGGGSGDEGGNTPSPPPPPVGIGPAGGTVEGPSGTKVVIPPGALTTNVDIRIEQTSVGSPALPSGLSAVGQMFAFTPHGTTFAVPVTMTLPFDPAAVSAGLTPGFYKTNAQDQWEVVTGAVFNVDSTSAEVTSFSSVQVMVPPLVRNDPVRIWEFATYSGDGSPEIRLDGDTLVGGQLEEIAEFGPAVFDDVIIGTSESRQSDEIANGFVFSSPNGVTYGVSAEAPLGRLGTSDRIGSITRLTQTQSFIKRAGDASLTFTLTAASIQLSDFNSPLLTGPAPLKAQILLAVQAYKTPTDDPFFYTAGRASIFGSNGFFFRSARDESFSRSHLWSEEDFDFSNVPTSYAPDVVPFVIGSTGILGCDGTVATLNLKGSIPYTVDLSTIDVDEEFTLRVDTFAEAHNRRGGNTFFTASPGDCQASSAFAYLRDPLEIGGSTLTFSGLEPTNNPLPAPTNQVLTEPASCVPGPGPTPEAGLLQFDAASYIVDEVAGAAPTITVTRTGGATGAVTATFTTTDGTAIADIDYTALNATVFFADGDTGQRVVTVPILLDQIEEIDKTVNLTLSQPGGCAALGTQTTAVLTIQDDDLPPPTGLPTALDPTFGSAGLAHSERFGGDRSAMALQADGKIVMVGGTFVDFILARFNADGSLDTSFDGDGKVTTDMVANEQEEALSVAIQPDGKIVVAGYTGTSGSGGPNNFAIARYNVDGSLDATFGAGGRIVSGVLGIAHAIAIQPDGRIVVAGDVPISSSADFSNFAVARYNANGTLDATFAGGQLTTDFAGGTNTARNIVLQANGAIIVSGEPIGTFTGSDHTDVARYDSNGNLDSSFGTAGKVTLNGARVGEGLALQGDGKLVLVGTIDVTIPPAFPGTVTEFAVMRLNADGTPDSSFGAAGSVSTPISAGERDSANAVALQADGKIVVAGSSSNINRDFAVARYNTDGTLDTSFGSLGKLTIDFFSLTDIAESVAIQPDGKMVLGGIAESTFDGYGVVRVLP